MPVWHQGLSWWDGERGVVWRADETDLVTDPPVKPGGILTIDPDLADSWWTGRDSIPCVVTYRRSCVRVLASTIALGRARNEIESNP
jgi:hypothetical protein